MPRLACRGSGLTADTSTGKTHTEERRPAHYDASVMDRPRPRAQPLRMSKPRKQSLRERLAINLRNERLARRWTQEELEHKSGVSQRYISCVESAKSAISIDRIERLADALGVDGQELLKRLS